MNRKKSKLLTFSLFLGLILAATSPGVVAQNNFSYGYSNGKITLETDKITIEIVGETNTPFFFFWDPNNVEGTYKIQFIKLFEVIDDGDGIYTVNDTIVTNSQLSLAKYEWEFSEFEIDTINDIATAVHFNITSLPTFAGQNEELPTIQFNNHLYADNPSALKFDVVIDDFMWQDQTAMLVLGYTLIQPDNHLNQTGNQIQFGDAFFQSQEQAQANGTEIDVGLSYGEGENGTMLYLSYEHFEGYMIHDPTIGLTISSVVITDPNQPGNIDDQTDLENNEDSTDTDKISSVVPDMSNAYLFGTSVSAVMISMLIPIVVYYKRR